MKINYYPLLLLSLLMGTTCLQCTLDDGNPGSNAPALTLHVEQDLSLIKLSWDTVRVTGFKEYVLLQSSGIIPNSPTPPVTQDVAVLTRIKEINTTTFSTTVTPNSPTICFKLYCSVDDRFLYSESVCIPQSVTTISGFFDRAGHDDDQPEVAMFDRVNSKLAAFDDESGTLSNSIFENSLFFPQLDLTTRQGAGQLYAFDLSTPQIRKYSFPGLALQNQRTFTGSLFGGTVSGNLVFVSMQAFSGDFGFWVLNSQTLSTIDSKQGFSGSRNLAVFEGDTLVVLEIADAGIIRYQVNSVGKVIQSNQFVTGVSQPGTQNTCDVKGDFYVGGRLATIVNKDADVITSLEVGINSFVQLCRFSPDGTRVAVINNNNNEVDLDLFDITNLPAAVKLTTYVLPNATFPDLYFRDDVMNVLGVNFFSVSPTTFILKFPM
jgi:hypothetical protein